MCVIFGKCCPSGFENEIIRCEMFSNIEKWDWNESFKGGQNELWQWGLWVMSKWCLLCWHRDGCQLMRIPYALFCMLFSTFILMITNYINKLTSCPFWPSWSTSRYGVLRDLPAFGHILNYSVTPNYIFQDRKGEEFMQKMWAPGSQRAPKSQEFLLEDDWLLLTSPKGQTAHQNLLTNLSAFFLPRNAHAVLSDRVNVISSPFNCWCRVKWSPFRRDKHWRRSMRKRSTSGISNKILSLSLLDNLSTRPSATFWRSGTGNKRGRHWHCHVHRLFNFQRLFQCSGCLLMIVAVTPFTGWGTATCFYSAAGSPNSKSSWNRQGVYPPGGAHSPWYPPVRFWATLHWVHLIEARTHQ